MESPSFILEMHRSTGEITDFRPTAEKTFNWTRLGHFGMPAGLQYLDKYEEKEKGAKLKYQYLNDIVVFVERTFEENVLKEKYEFLNDGKKEIDIAEGELGIYVTLCDGLDIEKVMSRRGISHIFAEGNCFYITCDRFFKEEGLAIIMTDGEVSGYSIERTPNKNERGQIIVNFPEKHLKIGESFSLSWEIFGYKNKEDFEAKAKSYEGYFHIDERLIFEKGEKVLLPLFTPEKITEILSEEDKKEKPTDEQIISNPSENGENEENKKKDNGGVEKKTNFLVSEDGKEVLLEDGCLNISNFVVGEHPLDVRYGKNKKTTISLLITDKQQLLADRLSTLEEEKGDIVTDSARLFLLQAGEKTSIVKDFQKECSVEEIIEIHSNQIKNTKIAGIESGLLYNGLALCEKKVREFLPDSTGYKGFYPFVKVDDLEDNEKTFVIDVADSFAKELLSEKTGKNKVLDYTEWANRICYFAKAFTLCKEDKYKVLAEKYITELQKIIGQQPDYRLRGYVNPYYDKKFGDTLIAFDTLYFAEAVRLCALIGIADNKIIDQVIGGVLGLYLDGIGYEGYSFPKTINNNEGSKLLEKSILPDFVLAYSLL